LITTTRWLQAACGHQLQNARPFVTASIAPAWVQITPCCYVQLAASRAHKQASPVAVMATAIAIAPPSAAMRHVPLGVVVARQTSSGIPSLGQSHICSRWLQAAVMMPAAARPRAVMMPAAARPSTVILP